MQKLITLFNKLIKISSINVLSIYLEIDPTVVGRNRAGSMIWLKDKIKEIKKSLNNEQLKEFEKIQSEVFHEVENQNSTAKSLVIFANPDFFEIIHIQINVKNEIWWGKPSIGQLEWLLEEYRNFGIIKIDTEKLHYYIVGLNELVQEWEENIKEDTLAWQRKHLPPEEILREKAIPGLRGGDTREIVERHVNEEIQKFWKSSTTSFELMRKQFNIKELILAGLDSQTEMFQKIVKTDGVNIIGKINIPRETNIKDLILSAQNLFKKFERESEKKLINNLIGRAAENASASIGMKNVLQIIQDGRASLTAISNSVENILLECNDCGYIMTPDLNACTKCSSKNLRFGSMRSLIPPLLRKYKTQLNIVSLDDSELFNKHGGIGALWRY